MPAPDIDPLVAVLAEPCGAALDLVKTAEVALAADRARAFFATAYMKRFFPAVRQARELLADMGEIISIHARSWQGWDLWNGPPDPVFLQQPSPLKANMGGGALLVHQDAATGRMTEYRHPPVNPFDLEMAEMVRRFEAGDPAYPSDWDGYVVDELIGRITASAQQGERLPVAWHEAMPANGSP